MNVTEKYIIYSRSDLNPAILDIPLEDISWNHLIGAPDLKQKQWYVLFLDDDQRVKVLYERGSQEHSLGVVGKIITWSEFRKKVLQEWL